jgi:hypothetical protein
MLIYITFGQIHKHNINGVIFDKNCVCVLNCSDYKEGREKAFKLFGDEFFTTYEFNDFREKIVHFPDGLKTLDLSTNDISAEEKEFVLSNLSQDKFSYPCEMEFLVNWGEGKYKSYRKKVSSEKHHDNIYDFYLKKGGSVVGVKPLKPLNQ